MAITGISAQTFLAGVQCVRDEIREDIAKFELKRSEDRSKEFGRCSQRLSKENTVLNPEAAEQWERVGSHLARAIGAVLS